MDSSDLCCAPLLAETLSEPDADELAVVLKALADPVRLRLVSLVAASSTGEACACDLPGAVDRSQPTVSHHLGQLVKAGILEREQRGKWAWFRVRTDRLGALCTALGATESCGTRPATVSARATQPAGPSTGSANSLR